MRLAWLTDIHLNFLRTDQQQSFARMVGRSSADVLLISGDIAEAPSLKPSLALIERQFAGQMYFVLGNHDYYRSDIGSVRANCHNLPGTYLHQAGPVQLTDTLWLVGVDGWADGRMGRPRESDLIFTDWHLIDDFRRVDAILNVEARLLMMRKFADDSAARLRQQLRECDAPLKILVVTHVPPFDLAAGHDGSNFADLWVPYLACQATGEVLLEFAARNPHIEIEVLCGHTHVARRTHPATNIVCRTGHAEYRSPSVQDTWNI